MANYALHVARSSGLADLLKGDDRPNENMLFLRPRIRVNLTRPQPHRGPTPGRPGRPGTGRPGTGRPGRPGGPGGSGGAVKAAVLAAAVAAIGKLWEWRWYAMGPVGVYVLVRCVKYVRQRLRNVAITNRNPNSEACYPGESVEGQALLSAYVLEMLKKNEFSDLDVFSTTSSFSSYAEISGPSVALYCTQHLHVKVLNYANYDTPLMQIVKDAMDSMKEMMHSNTNQMDENGYIVNEVANGVSFCGISRGDQAITLLINQELGDKECWDCCSHNLHEPVFLGKSFGTMSFMAYRRLTSAETLPFMCIYETLPGDPSFIVLACDGLCNLVQNMGLVQFAYQGVRKDMPLRPLCEMLLDLIKPSSIKMAVLLVEFKSDHQ